MLLFAIRFVTRYLGVVGLAGVVDQMSALLKIDGVLTPQHLDLDFPLVIEHGRVLSYQSLRESLAPISAQNHCDLVFRLYLGKELRH